MKAQGKVAEEEVAAVFEQLQAALDLRKGVILESIKDVMASKEKELLVQRDDLEFLLGGVRHVLKFTETLLQEGTDVEVAVSKREVTTRFATLLDHPTLYEPVQETLIFEHNDEEKARVGLTLAQLGKVVTGDISTDASWVDRSSIFSSLQLNRPHAFRVILLAREGKSLSGTVSRGAPFSVGPSSIQVCSSSLSFFLFSSLQEN